MALSMKHARRILFVGLVWLTAAGTLLAGLPHAACLCAVGPDKAKHVADAKPSGCCCGAGCTPAQTGCPFCGKHTEKSQDENDASRTQTAREAAVRPAPCRHVIVPSTVIATAASHGDKTLIKTFVLAAPPASDQNVAEFTPNLRDSREIHLLPPPTDLVTVLQHFLI
jgi:putative Ca2+/H+ antiporter (TMEM165/GDT1 family)